jgi:N-ethylmaleimide reductase
MTTTTKDLFSTYTLGGLELPNRILMAPMTRNRASAEGVQGELNGLYYGQRASAGLIITEGIYPEAMGKGYLNTPGLGTSEQVAGWKVVTDAVHGKGGRIYGQVMHAGRISHPSFLPGGVSPVAPSAVKPEGQTFTLQGPSPFGEPRALELSEIAGVIEGHRRAAENAFAGGFDGVELHAANGYLSCQFLSSNTNRRTDKYGGSPENRARFVLEALEAMASVKGWSRLGVRLSPWATFNDIHDDDPAATYAYILQALNGKDLAYVHVMLPVFQAPVDFDVAGFVRQHYGKTLILAGNFDRDSGNVAIAEGKADLIAYGRPFLANPDLPERFRRGAPLNEADQSTFYVGGEKGYADYPTLEE